MSNWGHFVKNQEYLKLFYKAIGSDLKELRKILINLMLRNPSTHAGLTPIIKNHIEVRLQQLPLEQQKAILVTFYKDAGLNKDTIWTEYSIKTGLPPDSVSFNVALNEVIDGIGLTTEIAQHETWMLSVAIPESVTTRNFVHFIPKLIETVDDLNAEGIELPSNLAEKIKEIKKDYSKYEEWLAHDMQKYIDGEMNPLTEGALVGDTSAFGFDQSRVWHDPLAEDYGKIKNELQEIWKHSDFEGITEDKYKLHTEVINRIQNVYGIDDTLANDIINLLIKHMNIDTGDIGITQGNWDRALVEIANLLNENTTGSKIDVFNLNKEQIFELMQPDFGDMTIKDFDSPQPNTISEFLDTLNDADKEIAFNILNKNGEYNHLKDSYKNIENFFSDVTSKSSDALTSIGWNNIQYSYINNQQAIINRLNELNNKDGFKFIEFPKYENLNFYKYETGKYPHPHLGNAGEFAEGFVWPGLGITKPEDLPRGPDGKIIKHITPEGVEENVMGDAFEDLIKLEDIETTPTNVVDDVPTLNSDLVWREDLGEEVKFPGSNTDQPRWKDGVVKKNNILKPNLTRDDIKRILPKILDGTVSDIDFTRFGIWLMHTSPTPAYGAKPFNSSDALADVIKIVIFNGKSPIDLVNENTLEMMKNYMSGVSTDITTGPNAGYKSAIGLSDELILQFGREEGPFANAQQRMKQTIINEHNKLYANSEDYFILFRGGALTDDPVQSFSKDGFQAHAVGFQTNQETIRRGRGIDGYFVNKNDFIDLHSLGLDAKGEMEVIVYKEGVDNPWSKTVINPKEGDINYLSKKRLKFLVDNWYLTSSELPKEGFTVPDTPTNVVDDVVDAYYHSRVGDLHFHYVHFGTYDAAVARASLQYGGESVRMFYARALGEAYDYLIPEIENIELIEVNGEYKLPEIYAGDRDYIVSFEHENMAIPPQSQNIDFDITTNPSNDSILITHIDDEGYRTVIDEFYIDVLDYETDGIKRLGDGDIEFVMGTKEGWMTMNSYINDLFEAMPVDVYRGDFDFRTEYQLYKTTIKPDAKVFDMSGKEIELVETINGTTRTVKRSSEWMQYRIFNENADMPPNISEFKIDNVSYKPEEGSVFNSKEEMIRVLTDDADVVFYTNEVEDPGSKSMYVLKEDAVEVTQVKGEELDNFNKDVKTKYVETSPDISNTDLLKALDEGSITEEQYEEFKNIRQPKVEKLIPVELKITDPVGLHMRPATQLITELGDDLKKLKVVQADGSVKEIGAIGLIGMQLKSGDSINLMVPEGKEIKPIRGLEVVPKVIKTAEDLAPHLDPKSVKRVEQFVQNFPEHANSIFQAAKKMPGQVIKKGLQTLQIADPGDIVITEGMRKLLPRLGATAIAYPALFAYIFYELTIATLDVGIALANAVQTQKEKVGIDKGPQYIPSFMGGKTIEGKEPEELVEPDWSQWSWKDLGKETWQEMGNIGDDWSISWKLSEPMLNWAFTEIGENMARSAEYTVSDKDMSYTNY